jgi:hypothetical protein
MTRRGVRCALAGPLLVASASTGVAETTYASTVAAGAASPAPPRRAADVAAAAGARLTVAAGSDGVVVDRLSIDFASRLRGEDRPCVVWTGGASTRIDLTDVSWDAESAGRRRAAAPPDSEGASLATYVAEMAWSSDVAGQVSSLAGPGSVKPIDFSIDAVESPEPRAGALFALGAAGLAVVAWSRRRRAARR